MVATSANPNFTEERAPAARANPCLPAARDFDLLRRPSPSYRVRALVEKHLPAEYRFKFSWRQLAGLLKRAAEGQQDVAEVSTALRIVLQGQEELD